MSAIEALSAVLVEILSDTDTGPLSDTPYIRAELDENDEGQLALFESESEDAWPTASLDIQQLANALIAEGYGVLEKKS